MWNRGFLSLVRSKQEEEGDDARVEKLVVFTYNSLDQRQSTIVLNKDGECSPKKVVARIRRLKKWTRNCLRKFQRNTSVSNL